MKIALCTTTIHVPHALKLMRRMDGNAQFFVAVDENTPGEVHRFVSEIDRAQHYFHGDGDWKCSNAIGFRTLARRNIAFLEALAWGADVIYSWDNDNLPINRTHFSHIHRMDRLFNGIKVTGTEGWFDPGTLLIPATRHRGFPHARHARKSCSPVVDARIGVAAGLVIGDPDIDSTTRIEKAPDIGAVHVLGQTGIVVEPGTWSVFNSQNTAVIRELIPSWFMAPGCHRHDDIFASLVVQRVMRDRGYHAHFGPPFTYQQRNPHDLMADLRAEIDGMSNVTKMAELLDIVKLPLKSVVDDTRIIYEALQHAEWYPKQACVAAFAWLDDCQELGL
jgi:hypothetical protein